MIRLPEEIISQHIMPYAYSHQPLNLIRDIKTFSFIYKKIMDLYYKAYRHHKKDIIHVILHFDALEFYKSFVLMDSPMDSSFNWIIPQLNEYDSKNTCATDHRFFRVVLAKINPGNRLKMYLRMFKAIKKRDMFDTDDESYL